LINPGNVLTERIEGIIYYQIHISALDRSLAKLYHFELSGEPAALHQAMITRDDFNKLADSKLRSSSRC